VSSDRSQSRLAVRYGKGKEDRKDEAMIARFDHCLRTSPDKLRLPCTL
jgi:hypothetical protein